MDPMSAMALIGMGSQVIGSILGVAGAAQHQQAQQQIVRLQQQQEIQRMQAMELDARRRQLEVIRNAQRAQSLSLAVATSQGAQFGSGLGGAQGQISGASGSNLLGISNNLEIGRNMFDINTQISAQKINMSDADTLSATGQGVNQFGGSLLNAAGTIKNLYGNYSGGTAGASSGATPSWLNPSLMWGLNK